MYDDFVRFMHENPFVRITAGWVLGVLIGTLWIPTGHDVSITIGCILAVGSVGLGLSVLGEFCSRHGLPIICSGIGIVLLWSSLGAGWQVLQRPDERLPEAGSHFAVVTEDAREKPKSIALRVRFIGAEEPHNQTLLYLQKERNPPFHDPELGNLAAALQHTSLSEKQKQALSLQTGDSMYVFLAQAPDTCQFDYYRRQGVRGRAYLHSQAWQMATPGQPTGWQEHIHRLQRYISSVYRQQLSPEVGGILQALTIGDKSQLLPQLRQAFADAGGAHILAVSGLHVGILYLGLGSLLAWLDRSRRGARLKQLLLILSVWGYALLCGLPASIVRASLMLSVMSMGKVIGRESYSFNAVAFAAFCLLLYRPAYLFDVGFQLSFSAVVGILAGYPLLYRCYSARTWLGNKIWSLMAVSIAAQAATLPFTLYYFGQFPLYFLLTNLWLIPAANMLLYSGMALLLTARIPMLLPICRWIPEQIGNVTFRGIYLLNQLPYASLQGLYLSLPYALLLGLLLFSGWLILRSQLSRKYCA